jgi:hypothetical protein
MCIAPHHSKVTPWKEKKSNTLKKLQTFFVMIIKTSNDNIQSQKHIYFYILFCYRFEESLLLPSKLQKSVWVIWAKFITII